MKTQKLPPSENNVNEKMVTPAAIGEILNLTGRAVCNHFHSKVLPGYRIGKAIRFRVSEVLEAIEKNSR
jgi:hypothetical protein